MLTARLATLNRHQLDQFIPYFGRLWSHVTSNLKGFEDRINQNRTKSNQIIHKIIFNTRSFYIAVNSRSTPIKQTYYQRVFSPWPSHLFTQYCVYRITLCNVYYHFFLMIGRYSRDWAAISSKLNKFKAAFII